jgi:hypothetical protein
MMLLLGIKVALLTRGNKYSVERERETETETERSRERDMGLFANK